MENQGFIILNGEVVGTFNICGNDAYFSFGYDKNQIENVFDFFSELRFFAAKIYFLRELTPRERDKYYAEYQHNYS